MTCAELTDNRTRNHRWAQRLLRLMVMMIFMTAATHALGAERLAVTSKIANIRSGPGTTYDVLWQVEKYHPFIVIEKKEGWVHFKDFENDKAWVHGSLLGKLTTVISIKNNCNVRSGPGTDAAVVFTVEKGVPFKVLEKKDDWLHIEHADGDKGWIYQKLVW